MKNEINIDDEVVFLYGYDLVRGTCIKINQKTYKIHVVSDNRCIEYVRNVEKHRVANIRDKFCVIWDTKSSTNGSYRIDYDTYPDLNSNYMSWSQPCYYIIEE